MKKVLLMLFACGLMTLSTFAQVASYVFTQATNTFDSLTIGKVLGSASTAAGTYFVDSTVAAGSTTVTSGIGLPIGFSFTYNGSNFDLFGVNADGWISFGQSSLTPSVNMNTSSATAPISATSTAPANLQNRLSVFGHALAGQAGSQLSYAILGTSPYRQLVIEWKKFRKSATATGDNLTFQIRLFETTNIVKFIYGTVTYSGYAPGTCQVGLRGSANTDYNNRSSLTSWATTTAGTANNSTVAIASVSIFPASGLTFNWALPVVTQDDAGLTAINSPITPIAAGTHNVSVTIKNFGTDSLKTASIGWSVNGVTQSPFTFLHPGLPKDSVNGPFTIGSYNFSLAGNNIIKAWSSMPNNNTDENATNDTITKNIFVQGYASLPFAESFNSTWVNGLGTRDVPSIYWSNTPSTGNSSWRRNDDGTSAAWTSTNGAYTPTGVGTGTLYSARFHSRAATAGTTGSLDAYLNFSPVGTKQLKFWHINTTGTDTLSVLMSNDGGTTFSLIQKFATATPWTQHSIILGTSTAANTILRFQVKNLSTTQGTDVGIDSVLVNILTINDAGLTAINTPSTPVAIGLNPVAVTVKNYGANYLNSAIINWSVNAIAQTPFTFSNAGLITGASNGPDTIGNFNFTAPGFYTIKAWTTLPNSFADEDNTNDTVTKTVYVQTYATIPFLEGFENTWVNKNDTNDVPSLYWSNNPAFGNNSWRRDNDSISAPWTEGSTGAYTPAGANNTTHSARFHSWDASSGTKGVMDLYLNFSPAGGKILDFWYINPDGTDSLSLYLSTDNGATFGFIQKFLTATTWTENFINLSTSTSPNCILRFRATSDYGLTDIGIDQVHVFLQPNNDMTALQWVSPVSGCGLTNAEPITVKVKNTGLVAQSNIPIIYSIDGGATIVGPELIPGPVNPGDTATFTFSATADFSVPGVHHCGFIVQLPGDAIALNDTIFMDVMTMGTINSFPFTENFNTGSSYYFLLSANANANVFYDTIGTQNTYGLHFTGKTNAVWAGGQTSTASAWANTSHQADAVTCGVDATSVSKLYMQFDLLETSSSTTNMTYTWYAAVANGTDTLVDINGVKFFNPSSPNDVYATKIFDLTNLASTSFSLKFVSACRRDDANTTSGVGDNVYFDNLALYIPPVINDLGPDTSLCQGNSITLDAGAGIGYSYVWTVLPSGNVVGNAQTLVVDTTGNYTVVVTNNLGFSVSDNITVTFVPAPIANAGPDSTIAYQTAITLQGSEASGTGPFIYSWTPANLLVDANVQNPTTISLNNSAIFTLTITDSITGCFGTDQVTIYISGGPLTVQISADPNTLCPGSCTSLIALPSGGTGTYVYDWTSVPAGFTSTLENPTACPTESTSYSVTINDGNGTTTATIDVVVNPLPVVDLGVDTTLCTDATITLNAGTGTTYLWSTGQITQSIVVDSTYANNGVATIWAAVTNASGCIASDTVVITFDHCLGMNQKGNNDFISLYPNPTTGMTTIIMNGFSNAVLNIYNIQGAAVYSENIKAENTVFSKQYDFSYLPKGLYLIRISNDKASKISKLIIQ